MSRGSLPVAPTPPKQVDEARLSAGADKRRMIRNDGYRHSLKIMLKQADRAGWLEAGLSRSCFGYGIKWLGVPRGLATLKGGCFDRAFALRRLALRLLCRLRMAKASPRR